MTSPRLDVALQDYTKYGFDTHLSPTRSQLFYRRWRNRNNPAAAEEEENKPSPHIPAGPKKDYSLKEGQTFSISIPGRGAKPTFNNAPTNTSSNPTSFDLLGGLSTGSSSSATTSSGGGGGGLFPLLPPPPSAPKKR